MMIFEKWIYEYCSGSRMPKEFREEASDYFQKVYKKANDNSDLCSLLKTNEYIYRVQSFDVDTRKMIEFDDLYYSFSNDINGLYEVVRKDKYLKTNIVLIMAIPKEPINMNELLNLYYDDYRSRYTKENEIVSKMDMENVIGIWFLKNASDLLSYDQKGVRIDLRDISFSYKKITKKYKISN